jgi:hypothetical protein
MSVKIEMLSAQEISKTSWLNESKYEWFVKGHAYAATQTRAISALSKVSPEELYFAVWLIMRGAGLPHPNAACKSSENNNV